MNIDEAIMEIKNDKSSGASEMMLKAIEYLTSYSEAYEGEVTKEYYKEMIDVGRQIIAAQPSMAPLFNAVNTVLLEVERGSNEKWSIKELKEAVREVEEYLKSNSRDAMMRIQQHIGELIKDKQTILTHSYSSTVIKSFISAHKDGMDFEVIVTESRPLFEGRRTAELLSEKGIDVTLIADMASFHFLKDVDTVLTGTDCVCKLGAVNKIGTKGLASAAKHSGIPFYILSEKRKFLPLKYLEEPVIEEKDPVEILMEREGIKVKNIYFDITPYDFIKGIVTEDGIIDQHEVQELLEVIEVCQSLIDKR